MPTLPPELAAFSYVLDAQPTPVRDAVLCEEDNE